MSKVQRIIMADSHGRSWIVLDASGRPVTEINEYLLYLHHLGRSPNTVRAYAHHLQLFRVPDGHAHVGGSWFFDLATFVGWLRYLDEKTKQPRSGLDHQRRAGSSWIVL